MRRKPSLIFRLYSGEEIKTREILANPVEPRKRKVQSVMNDELQTNVEISRVLSDSSDVELREVILRWVFVASELRCM